MNNNIVHCGTQWESHSGIPSEAELTELALRLTELAGFQNCNGIPIPMTFRNNSVCIHMYTLLLITLLITFSFRFKHHALFINNLCTYYTLLATTKAISNYGLLLIKFYGIIIPQIIN